jgi:hypothetical protein
MALAVAAAVFAGCLGGEHHGATVDRSPAQSRTAAEQRPGAGTALRIVQLHPLKGSGVRGAARLLLRGRELSVESFVAGAAPGRVHMQHIHVPPGGGDGSCPTARWTPTGTAWSV